MALADVGAFGQGWLKGQQQGLSNYAAFADLARRRDADERARQAQALQSLIHGTSLAQTAPDVAERAAQEPDRYGLSPDTVMPGVAQARALREAETRLTQAIAAGDIDTITRDPEVGRVIASKPDKYLPLLKEAIDTKRRNAIMNDPATSDQDKARLLYSSGQKGVDIGQVFPSIAGEQEYQKTRGGLRGKQGLIGPVTRETEQAKADVNLDYAEPTAAAKAQGEFNVKLGPGKPGLPGTTQAGQLAIQNETPAQREYRLSHQPLGELKPTDISQAQNRIRIQARQEVAMGLQHAKPVFDALPPNQQSEIIDYYTAIRQNQMASQDPVFKGQALPQVPPKPQSVIEFEGQAQSGGFGAWLKSFLPSFLGGDSSTPAVASPEPAPATAPAPPRTLRSPEQQPAASAMPVPQGMTAKEGDTVRNKKTGQEYIVQQGMLVPK